MKDNLNVWEWKNIAFSDGTFFSRLLTWIESWGKITAPVYITGFV
jgi:hypothetical protein